MREVIGFCFTGDTEFTTCGRLIGAACGANSLAGEVINALQSGQGAVLGGKSLGMYIVPWQLGKENDRCELIRGRESLT